MRRYRNIRIKTKTGIRRYKIRSKNIINYRYNKRSRYWLKKQPRRQIRMFVVYIINAHSSNEVEYDILKFVYFYNYRASDKKIISIILKQLEVYLKYAKALSIYKKVVARRKESAYTQILRPMYKSFEPNTEYAEILRQYGEIIRNDVKKLRMTKVYTFK